MMKLLKLSAKYDIDIKQKRRSGVGTMGARIFIRSPIAHRDDEHQFPTSIFSCLIDT